MTEDPEIKQWLSKLSDPNSGEAPAAIANMLVRRAQALRRPLAVLIDADTAREQSLVLLENTLSAYQEGRVRGAPTNFHNFCAFFRSQLGALKLAFGEHSDFDTFMSKVERAAHSRFP